MEDNLNGIQAEMKTPSIGLAGQFCTVLGPAQPQLVATIYHCEKNKNKNKNKYKYIALAIRKMIKDLP